MTEEDVFLAALDQPDAAARAAYLDDVCGTDTSLREQVEALLTNHFRSGEFLDVPAAEQIKGGSNKDNTVTMQGDAVAAANSPDDESDDLHFLTPSTRPDSLGRIGHYEVLQVLGKGGFGIVFRAFDDVLQRVVALKVMAPQLAATSPARKRFLREARTSAQVRHENVVQVHEVGEEPLPYLVMEFIPGETLQQRLDRVGPVDPVEVVRIGHQIAEGLAAAHSTDLIHRDIKPGNILLEGGQLKAKITDFGLARAADDASISQSGIIAGTPMYMAPEQAKGDKLDHRADLFSLGSVLYQMVAGRPPFRANSTLSVLKRVAEDDPRDIREIISETPQWMCNIIAKLHAKNPDERYQSAREVGDVLADCEAQLKANSKLKDYSRIPPGKRRPSGRRKWVAAAVLMLPLFVFGAMELAGVTQLFQGRQLEPSDYGGVPVSNAPGDALPPATHALQFDGDADYVTIPLHYDGSTSITIEATVQISEWPTKGTFGDIISNTRAGGVGLVVASSGFRFPVGTIRAGTGSVYVDVEAPRFDHDLNRPVKLAGVLGSGEARLYRDGKLVDRKPLRDPHKSSVERFLLGANPRGRDNDFIGQIAEVRISNIARYSEDYTPALRLNADEHTLALFHFDEGEGNVLQDSSGNGRHGKIVGAKWVKSDGSPIDPLPVATQGPLPKKTLLGFPGRVVNATYSPDGRLLAAAGDGAVRVFDAESGGLRYALKVSPQASYYAVTFSPDSRHLLTAPDARSDDISISIWEADTGEPVGTLAGHEQGLFELSFSPDGKTLLSCGRDHVVRLWDFPSRELLREIPTPGDEWVRSAVFSKTGTIALGKGSACLMDSEGKVLRTLDKNAGPLCFSPDGKRLAGTIWRQGLVIIWDVETGNEVASWRAHEGYANGIAFSRDGNILVTAGSDGKVRFWDVATQRELAQVSHDKVAYWVAFSPDGQTLATTGFDRVVKLWDVSAVLAGQSKSKAMPPIAPFTDADVARIAGLPAAEQVEEVRRELMRRNPGYDARLTPTISSDGIVTGLTLSNGRVTDISPLRGLPLTKLASYAIPGLTDLTPLRGMPLEDLKLWGWSGSDLTPLKGMPLKRLNCGGGGQKLDLTQLAGLSLEYLCVNHTEVSDLTPLRGMPLKGLLCQNTGVSDLTPLRGLTLTHLLITKTSVSDLSPLKGMPLDWLECDGAAVTDLSPIKDLPLMKIRCDFQADRDAEILRSIKTLETINGKPAAEFWERYDKGEFSK